MAIIKHTNPCGCAEGASLAEAYRKALACDPVSAFGSVVAVNRFADLRTAEELAKLFVEAVVAPGFTQEALSVLTRKKNLRLLEVGRDQPGTALKSVSGGYLVQSEDRFAGQSGPVRKPSATARRPQERAQRCASPGRSSSTSSPMRSFTPATGRTVGIGAGQMSRVDAAKVGAMKAVLPLDETVVASDAFFPFPDGVEEVARRGATAVIQPGGSKRDGEVIAAANRLGLAMVCTGSRHFRH